MMPQFPLFIGKILHIGKIFESYDGCELKNRFMCIVGVQDSNLILLPMTTFKNEEHKKWKLSNATNFEYSIKHGNTRDGYIKCNQIYLLSFDYLNKFSKEVSIKSKMNPNVFNKLINHLNLLKNNDNFKIIKKEIKFNDINITDNINTEIENNDL